MPTLAPFVERRSRHRLEETPLRRRNHIRPASQERRAKLSIGFDIASTLELNLDRYPTKAAMLTFLQSIAYAAEGIEADSWRAGYLEALGIATDVLRDAESPAAAIATLRGSQAWMRDRA